MDIRASFLPVSTKDSALVTSRSRRDVIQLFKTLLGTIFGTLMLVDSLGLYPDYYYRLRYLSHAVHDSVSEYDEYSDTVAGCAGRQWEVVLADMRTRWQTVRDVCSLLLPAMVSFLQIGGVSNSALARSTAICSWIFASVGLAMSIIYLVNLSSMNNRKVRSKWVKASQNLGLGSIEFWAYLALPVSSLLWSIFFFTLTILIDLWAKQVGSDGDPTRGCAGGAIIGAACLTLLFGLKIIQIYRAIRMLWRGDR